MEYSYRNVLVKLGYSDRKISYTGIDCVLVPDSLAVDLF